MKVKILLSLALVAAVSFGASADGLFRYVGGDISLLPEYEAANAKYYTKDGQPISDVLSFCYDEGMNIMRVRLFVNPDDYTGSDKDPNAKQDLAYIIPLCQRIKQQGFALMLDFHYSDTWADPVKQWTPKAWEGLSDTELYQKIYDYTRESLLSLKDAGVVPDFIQPGNEISYGMLWGPKGGSNPKKVYADSDENWPRFARLLRNAIQACREVCPDAGIILHNERVAKVEMLRNFFIKMKQYNIDYDIIGLSYYPYFHGSMSVLDTAMTAVGRDNPDKQIMIVETGYSYQWEVPGTSQKVDYPYSEEGQDQFAHDLVETLLKHEACTGLVWWWMEYNAYRTSLSGWYNAPLFNSLTGRATPALTTICSFGSGHPQTNGVGSLPDAAPALPEAWYDLQGRRLQGVPSAKGLYINNGRKVLIP